MLNFVLIMFVAFLEIGGVTLLMKQVFGYAALKRNIMNVIYGLMWLGLFFKGWFNTNVIQWFAINFILFFLLSVFYCGAMEATSNACRWGSSISNRVVAFIKFVLLPMIEFRYALYQK